MTDYNPDVPQSMQTVDRDEIVQDALMRLWQDGHITEVGNILKSCMTNVELKWFCHDLENLIRRLNPRHFDD